MTAASDVARRPKREKKVARPQFTAAVVGLASPRASAVISAYDRLHVPVVDIDEVERASLVHVPPIEPAALAAAAALVPAAPTRRVVIDLGAFVPGRGEPGSLDGELAEPWLKLASIVQGDAAEIAAFAEAHGIALPQLLAKLCVGEAVITLGARGGVVVPPDRPPYRFDAVPARGDGAGAGSAFLAAYATARLRDGADPRTAARRAAAFAAEHVEGQGHLPT